MCRTAHCLRHWCACSPLHIHDDASRQIPLEGCPSVDRDTAPCGFDIGVELTLVVSVSFLVKPPRTSRSMIPARVRFVPTCLYACLQHGRLSSSPPHSLFTYSVYPALLRHHAQQCRQLCLLSPHSSKRGNRPDSMPRRTNRLTLARICRQLAPAHTQPACRDGAGVPGMPSPAQSLAHHRQLHSIVPRRYLPQKPPCPALVCSLRSWYPSLHLSRDTTTEKLPCHCSRLVVASTVTTGHEEEAVVCNDVSIDGRLLYATCGSVLVVKHISGR